MRLIQRGERATNGLFWKTGVGDYNTEGETVQDNVRAVAEETDTSEILLEGGREKGPSEEYVCPHLEGWQQSKH